MKIENSVMTLFKLCSTTLLTTLVSLFFAAVNAQTVDASQPLKITVYGASGKIGSRIVREALDRGHFVTGISRRPSRIKEKHERFSIRKGDVLDTASVTEALTGQDIVIASIRGKTNRREPENGFYRKAATSLVNALRNLGEGAPRLIFVGGAGTLEVEPGVTMADNISLWNPFAAEILGHKAALDYFRTVTDVKWTYFSPALRIRPGERTGKFRLGGDQMIKDAEGNSEISMEDYAMALIDEAETPRHINHRFTIGY